MQVFTSDSETSAESDSHLSDLEFGSLGLPEAVMQGIEAAGFRQCTPIQAKTLPIALAGHDVAGQAQTGTGKTAAFLIALFCKLARPDDSGPRPPGPRALILAPTRELAVQIHADATALAKFLPYRFGLAFGGTDYETQRRELADGVDDVVSLGKRLVRDDGA